VDDHAVVRAGYRLLLSQLDEVDEVLDAENGEDAYQFYQQHKPDVVVMDLNLPGMSGLACIRKILAHDAQAKILVFSIHNEPVYITRALEAGALGYITKSSASEMLTQGVHKVAAGEKFIEPELQQYMSKQKSVDDVATALAALSSREFEVFSLIAKGYTVQDVADKLFLSAKTVANYNTQVKAKLHVKTISELTRLAYQYGVLSEGES